MCGRYHMQTYVCSNATSYEIICSASPISFPQSGSQSLFSAILPCPSPTAARFVPPESEWLFPISLYVLRVTNRPPLDEQIDDVGHET